MGGATMTTRNAWRPVVAYGAVSGANQLLWLTFTPITTDAAHHYGVSEGAIGWLAELFPLLYVVLAVPTGALIDRHLPRWLAVGALLTAAGAVVRLGGDAYAPVLAGQLLVAVAQPLLLNAVTKVSERFLAASERPTGIAVSSAGIFAGMLLALVLGAAFGGGHIVALLIVQAVLAVAGAGWLLALLRTPPVGAPAATGAGSASTLGVAALRAVWRDHYLRLLTGLVCLGFGMFIALTTWLQTLLKPAGVSDTAAGYLLVVMVVAGVAGSALLPPWLVRTHRQVGFLLVSVLAASAALVVLAFVPGLGVGVAVALVLGVFLLTDLPVILELAEQRAGAAGGTATALLWLAGNGAGLVVALVIQLLRHQPTVAFLVLAALPLAGCPLLGALRRGAGRDEQRVSPTQA